MACIFPLNFPLIGVLLLVGVSLEPVWTSVASASRQAKVAPRNVRAGDVQIPSKQDLHSNPVTVAKTTIVSMRRKFVLSTVTAVSVLVLRTKGGVLKGKLNDF